MCCCHGLSLGYHLYNSAISAVTQASRIPGHSRTVCETCTLQEIMVQVMIMLHLGSRSGDGPELKRQTDACILWRSRSFVHRQNCQGYYKFFLLPPKQSAPSLTESISVPWFRLLSLENMNFSTSTLFFRLAVGKGWKCLWPIISLSNFLGNSKYRFCSCLLALKKLNYLK